LERGQLGETYNIGGNTELSNMKLAALICDLMDELCPREKSYHSLIQFVQDRLGHDWRYAINPTKISESLGWQPQETIAGGMRKTLDHYLDLTSNRRFLTSTVEL
jgi:dTDP-glucose 4,6-dehydratase